MTDTKTVTVPFHDRLSLNTYSLGSNCGAAMSVNTNLDADGETYPLMICGEDGTTWTIASTNSDFVFSTTSGTTNTTQFNVTAQTQRT